MAQPTESRSPWFSKTPDKRRYPRLENDHTTDIAIVGGGIVGCLTAYRLAELGAHVTLLEANNIATGDTGLTTAFVTRVPDTDHAALAKHHGEPFVEQLYRNNTAAQNYLRQLVGKQRLNCDWHDIDTVVLSYKKDDPDLEREWRILQQAEPRAHRASEQELAKTLPTAKAGIVIEQEARFDPRQFVLALLATPTGERITIFEQTPVKDFSVETGAKQLGVKKGAVTIKTEHGTVNAQKVIVTTGLPNPNLNELHGLFTPQITYALLAKYDKLPIGDVLMWDTQDPYNYLRVLDGQVLLGGADTKPGGDTTTAFKTLEQFLQKNLPGKHEISARWFGTIFTTQDGLPYVDAHPHYDGRVLVASGFSGNGMVMGTGAGLLLADLALGKPNDNAKLFGFARNNVQIAKPTPVTKEQYVPAPTKSNKKWVVLGKIALPLVYALALIAPTIAFFGKRGTDFLFTSPDLKTLSILIFPLVGLYAFTLVWAQVILGSGMPWWRRVYRWIELFHRTQGIFVLLFAGLHPTLLFYVYWLDYFKLPFVRPDQHLLAWMGEFQLTLIIITVLTALLRKTRLVQRYWRYIHWANYVVFASAWIHSWFLGSDVRSSGLRYLWFFYAASVLVLFSLRIRRGLKNKAAQRTAQAEPTGRFVPVIAFDKLLEQKPLCVTVEKQPIALYRINGRVFATTNTCSHQGGPLCEGQLKGGVIQCPWHGSRFDVKTGKVVAGPAQRAVKIYRTRVRNGQVEIEL